MNFPRSLPLFVMAAFALAGCQRTVSSSLPTGQAAYAAVAVPTEVMAPTEYVLRPGDRVNVLVLREAEFSAQKALIDLSGSLTVPALGSVKAAGLTQDQLAAEVRSRLAATYLRDPRVSISVDTPALTTVSVEGEVALPGVYEIPQGATLLTAMALGRSPTQSAKLDQVIIFRTINGERFGGRFDLSAIRAGKMPDPQLLPGDTVVVGFSNVRRIFQDFLQAAPIFNIFTRY